ncbi:hypothetical protein J1605_018381 [Eschrichtius robustus]|uniref:Uncharacterized protein n=1 Tax=Eschrichtius robustus TaxID=9764 RepID=A0AB34HWJ8_ESCRO|nr:hypothetical protein J1605_018381 [Eschrichtius robustus]
MAAASVGPIPAWASSGSGGARKARKARSGAGTAPAPAPLPTTASTTAFLPAGRLPRVHEDAARASGMGRARERGRARKQRARGGAGRAGEWGARRSPRTRCRSSGFSVEAGAAPRLSVRYESWPGRRSLPAILARPHLDSHQKGSERGPATSSPARAVAASRRASRRLPLGLEEKSPTGARRCCELFPPLPRPAHSLAFLIGEKHYYRNSSSRIPLASPAAAQSYPPPSPRPLSWKQPQSPPPHFALF